MSAAESRDIAKEVAAKKGCKVYDVESPEARAVHAGRLCAALKQFIDPKQPKLVLMPHTYQVRDFAPKLATALAAR